MRNRLLPLLVLGLALAACQTTMSVEEAKKVTAEFAGTAFVPPPRTIEDITAILDQQKPDPAAVEAARARADQPAPDTSDPSTLARFHFERGLAAREIGRARQEIDDLTKALGFAGPATNPPAFRVLQMLAVAEVKAGNYSRALDYRRQAVAAVPPRQRAALIPLYSTLVSMHVARGDLDAAEEALRGVKSLNEELKQWPNQRAEVVVARQAHVARAEAAVLAARGRFVEAEILQRRAVAVLAADPVHSRQTWLDDEIAALARLLVQQGRLLEAENEARRALLGSLGKRGRYSPQTAFVLRALVQVIQEQGRFADAEALARAAVDIYEKTGSRPDSVQLAITRGLLAQTLSHQQRYAEALAQYEAIRAGLATDPVQSQRFLGGHVGYAASLLLGAGDADRALEILRVALDRRRRVLGDRHGNTALVRGYIARAYLAKGDRPRALREFREATEILLGRTADVDEETTTRVAADQRLVWTLMAYLGLLAEIRGTPLEREAGIDATAEAFRLAEVVRGRSVERALDASAARAVAETPALADLVRREQDAKKQMIGLQGLLRNVLSAPSAEQDPKVVKSLRAQIDALREARQALLGTIDREFAAYAELVNPSPATLDQARASLAPGEALISLVVLPRRTFVWALSRQGPAAFAVVPMGAREVETAVAKLRKALDSGARALGEIPQFDVATAHDLHRALLEPVAVGWREASHLMVVPHGALGQLPFSLLVTRLTTLAADEGALFARYRAVPWLARRHAVTVLPSVGALATLRRVQPADPRRRPFVGFGDPYFSAEQARRAAHEPARTEVAALASRGAVTLRNLKVESVNSARLAMLPRLPDTADEIRSIARAMGADPARDVFLGAAANEQRVKTMTLTGYRVIAFATHGLVPGDLDGLTQPALALSAPEVANVDGDGLLTMEEILALRLNADWVVLSACNTGSGQGSGSEAISGLGRAFFYAGARALLVSNWPVETTSARALTTELFRRQAADPRLSRAAALQQTMNALIDEGRFVDPETKRVVFSYAHPIFWAPFTLVGDGGGEERP